MRRCRETILFINNEERQSGGLYTSGDETQKRSAVERRHNNTQHYSGRALLVTLTLESRTASHPFPLRLQKNGTWTQFISSYRAGRARSNSKLMEEATCGLWGPPAEAQTGC